MDLYKELAALRCFTHSDIVQLTGVENHPDILQILFLFVLFLEFDL